MALLSASFSSYTTSGVAAAAAANSTHQLTPGWFQVHPSIVSTHFVCPKFHPFRAFHAAVPAKSSPPFLCSPSRVSCAHGNSASGPLGDDSEEEVEKSSQVEGSEDFEVERGQAADVDSPGFTTSFDGVSESGTGFPSGRDSPSSSASPSNGIVNDSGRELQNEEQLRETLAALTQSLALLSAMVNELSSTVKTLSAALSAQSQTPSSASSSPTPEPKLDSSSSFSSSETRKGVDAYDDRDSKSRTTVSSGPPEPWDNSAFGNVGTRTGEGEADLEISQSTAGSYENRVPPHLVEENRRAHKLAYKLQQSFVQARIQGLGKPFQVAAEEFVDTCMDAHAVGLGLKELQLQLILQDGSLTGAFSIRNQRWSDDSIMNEESRIRSLWVRLIYATITQVNTSGAEETELDPIDAFVKQVLQQALEKGDELERVKLEQNFAGQTINSGAVKAMRENQYLILLTLEKVKGKRA